jgi:hypothetical protein
LNPPPGRDAMVRTSCLPLKKSSATTELAVGMESGKTAAVAAAKIDNFFIKASFVY